MNMQDERLSIGDYLHFTHNSESFDLCVTEVKKNGVEANSDSEAAIYGFYRYEYISGIKITPEILERLGFWQLDDVQWFHSHKNIPCFIEKICENNLMLVMPLGDEIEDDRRGFETSIKHVHELQRLVFSLTKEKLVMGDLCK